MSQVALYRKYRSQNFDDLVGQGHITQTLRAAISGGRIAQAFLFTGPRGTGKTSTARILAKSLNCELGPIEIPCDKCAICLAIASGYGGDVIELDAASEAGVDEVRKIIESAQYAPMEARYKIFVIDEVHDMSSKGFDALLKTIEEPPPHVVFILATTEYNKVPLTIRSRCQKYEFHRGSLRDLVSRLEFVCNAEAIEYELPALVAIAKMADGGFRDALTLLEQVVITSSGSITLESVTRQLGLIDSQETDRLLEAALAGNTFELVRASDEAVRSGKEPRSVLESLLLRLSELTHALAGLDEGIEPERAAADHALAVRIGQQDLLRFRALLADAHKEIRDVTLPRLWLELALLRLTEAPQPPAPPAQSEPARKATPPPPLPRSAPPPEKAVAQRVAQTKTNGAPPVAKSAPGVSVDVAAKWADVVKRLAEKFPAAGKMLAGAFLSGTEGTTAVVSFTNKFQYDRIVGEKKNPDRMSPMEVLTLTFREVMQNHAWNLRLQLSPEMPPSTEDAAVQLPAEGEELAKLVEEVFDVQTEKS